MYSSFQNSHLQPIGVSAFRASTVGCRAPPSQCSPAQRWRFRPGPKPTSAAQGLTGCTVGQLGTAASEVRFKGFLVHSGTMSLLERFTVIELQKAEFSRIDLHAACSLFPSAAGPDCDECTK